LTRGRSVKPAEVSKGESRRGSKSRFSSTIQKGKDSLRGRQSPLLTGRQGQNTGRQSRSLRLTSRAGRQNPERGQAGSKNRGKKQVEVQTGRRTIR